MKTLAEKITELPSGERRAVRRLRDSLSAGQMTLRELRDSLGVSQEAMAHRLGTDQGGVSRFERREEIKLATLRSYVEALGGELHVIAHFPDRPPIELTIPAPVVPRSARSTRK